MKNISRYKAASTHLAISAAIAALVLLIMLALWYPPPLFTALGGENLAALIVGVDIVLGPLITLIIFDTRKKGLVFDLSVVVALQLGALGYGIHTMYAARPAFIVFTGQEFSVVSAVDIDEKNLAKASIESFRHFSLTGPVLVAAEPPADPQEQSDIAFTRFLGIGIQHYPKYYVPYSDKRQQVLKESRPLADLALESEDKERLKKYLAQSPRNADKLRYLPVTSDNKPLTAVIDASSGNMVDILDIKPGIAKHQEAP
ncbi:MAG: TfpX/TfpZ family type IV pilin accessory protein [Sideroxyarcus sp.]|nr:TfpX/TfpZ family type IV pilin accessory protein [Sideroxyarcus sp.]